MDQFLSSLSIGLDAVEGEVFGATTYHGKRLAILCLAMGRSLGWNEDNLIRVAACALLHDIALPRYFHLMAMEDHREENFGLHCIQGDEDVSHLPFPMGDAGIIKYHHEYVDRSGPFGWDANDVPLESQWIAMTDDLDIHYDFRTHTKPALSEIRTEIRKRQGVFYTVQAADALLAVLDDNLAASLEDACINDTFIKTMPQWIVEKKTSELMGIAEIVANITDCKSKFTAKHSIQIANRAHWMTRFYGHDTETCATVYLAAAFHDIGKLLTPTSILEKPGKLMPEEYRVITDHVRWSYRLLKDVDGFDTICRWAVTHHRKLNGTGYPDELPDEYLNLDFFSRMMACIDVYQAVREPRPYHVGRTHRETMAIIREMAVRGEIDKQITQDMDKEMARFELGDGDVPDPRIYGF